VNPTSIRDYEVIYQVGAFFLQLRRYFQ